MQPHPSAMTLNPTARATARRNVADRIDRFLNSLQRVRRLPNRRELFWLRVNLFVQIVA